MSVVPRRATRRPAPRPAPPEGHMVVCGDDALAHRIASELAEVYRQTVVLVTPAGGAPDPSRPGVRAHLVGTVPPDEPTLVEAGVRRAQALALLHEDDEVDMRAAFLARRLNPHVRLVLRMYNRNLGHRMAELLDQAREQTDTAVPAEDDGRDATTIVLSDADTAALALAATAVAGTRRIVQADGLLPRAAEHMPAGPAAPPGPGTAYARPPGAPGTGRPGGTRSAGPPDRAAALRSSLMPLLGRAWGGVRSGGSRRLVHAVGGQGANPHRGTGRCRRSAPLPHRFMTTCHPIAIAPRSGLVLAAPPPRPEGTRRAVNRMCVRRGVARFALCRS